MFNLKHLAIDARNFVLTLGEKHKRGSNDVINRNSKRIFSRLQEYDSNIGDPTLVIKKEWGPDEDNLTKLYSSSLGSKRSAIRGNIMAISKRCALCNSGPSSELDHYLPKSEFPEYSIYAPNLVPACHACNHAKGDRYKEDGAALFVYPYYRTFHKDQFLRSRISVLPNAVLAVYEIFRPATATPQDFLVIQNHFRTLDLLQRYGDQALEELSENRIALVELFDDGRDALVTHLDRQRRSALATVGINHWRTQLYSGLLNNAIFLSGGVANIPEVTIDF